VDGGPRDVTPYAENAAPELPMGVDVEEALTRRDEAHNVKDRVWCELVKLHTVNEKHSTKKFMDWDREVTEEKL
jgi:hypothetical protein